MKSATISVTNPDFVVDKPKVYCRDCYYYHFPNIDGSSIYEYCLFTASHKDTPVRRVPTVMTCEEARYNQNNNCEHYQYKRKWWKFWIRNSK